MLKNYLIVAWRNLLRNKVLSVINIAGLAIGLSVSFLLYQYVLFEKSYDNFNVNADQIFRIPIEYTNRTSDKGFSAMNHPATGPALKAEYPEVKEYARMVRASLFGAMSLTAEQGASKAITFKEDRMYITDASFLRMFSYSMKEGNAESALLEPNTIVLTEKTATKYFGNGPVVGKVLKLDGEHLMKVTGVLNNIPENSHLQFDALISFTTMGEKWGFDVWGWPEFYTYIQLQSEATASTLESKMADFSERHVGEIGRKFNLPSRFFLQPIKDIHLKSDFLFEQNANGNENTVYFITLLAIFILSIAWINYINLSTAKSLERSREVGLRKVVGARRIQLVLQFLFDALVINSVSIFIATVIISLSIPLLNVVAAKDISTFLYNEGLWHNTSFWIIFPAAFIAGVFIAGLYPALVMSSFKPVLVLKGRFYGSPSGNFVRKFLVSFQYCLSILLLAGTVLIYQQLTFMNKEDAGYAKDEILVLDAPTVFDSTVATKMQYLKTTLKQTSSVSQVTLSNDVPGHPIADRNSVRRMDQRAEQSFVSGILGIDPDYLNAFDMKLVAGRTFEENEYMSPLFGDPNLPQRPVKILVNEQAALGLGYTPEEIIKEKIAFRYGRGEHEAEVIGVVKNYHQTSLKNKFTSIIYVYPPEGWRYVSLRVNTKDAPNMLTQIKETYTQAFPGSAFDYFFLDDHFNSQYKADEQFGVVFLTFTALAIVVACLGLLGLSIFTSTQRTREIGIRKVLGASLSTILMLFSKDSIRLLAITYAICVPAIWYGSTKWLDTFAFHIDLGWALFLIPPMFLLVISLVTIVLVCLKTALMNPVNSLKQAV